MSRKYVDAPVPIRAVLDAALTALATDGRFRSVPNGRIEVAWRQARHTKGDESPPRYFVGVELLFEPLSEAERIEAQG